MIRTWIRLFGLVALVLSLVLVARPTAAQSCTLGVGIWDDQNPCIGYSGSGWVHLSGQSTSIYVGGTTSYSNGVYNDTASISFQGSSIAHCGHKGPQRGYVSYGWISSSGPYNLGSVDFYAPSFQVTPTCITFQVSTGTLHVVNLNTNGKHIDVDYFIVN